MFNIKITGLDDRWIILYNFRNQKQVLRYMDKQLLSHYLPGICFIKAVKDE